MFLAMKAALSALIIVGVSELSRVSTFWAALLASLPLISILAFCWIFYERRDAQEIVELSYSILWLVLPSLLFFIFLPMFLKNGFGFVLSLISSIILMLIAYFALVRLKGL